MSFIYSPDLPEKFLNDRVSLYKGDCLDILSQLATNSFSACVTDPPYHLNFMGKLWDGGDIAFQLTVWQEVLRVLKPGAYLLAFGGTRTYHRLACAIEDAGFEIRDSIQWLYGSGFPKNRNISKAIDEAAGVIRPKSPTVPMHEKSDVGEISKNLRCAQCGKARASADPCRCPRTEDIPITPEAIAWNGWGTALKPACELVVMARKPLASETVHDNVLQWGAGGLNIDACRIAGEKPATTRGAGGRHGRYGPLDSQGRIEDDGKGRYPANVIHDGSDEVTEYFPDSQSAGHIPRSGGTKQIWGHGKNIDKDVGCNNAFEDKGSVARFFYTAKADNFDRMASDHPTVKPVDLMQYLIRLVTPKDGLVLDLFAGSGTTGEAAWREGVRAVLIEKETEYQNHIRVRMEMASASFARRKAAVIAGKVASGRKKQSDLPLFT